MVADAVHAGQASANTGVAALLMYVGCYQLSFGPISWLIVGEVFPLAVRGEALALATVTNFGANFGVSLFLPYAEVLPLPSLPSPLTTALTRLLFRSRLALVLCTCCLPGSALQHGQASTATSQRLEARRWRRLRPCGTAAQLEPRGSDCRDFRSSRRRFMILGSFNAT